MSQIETTELGEIENLYKQYETWCKSQGLFPEFGKEFFDWMDNAGQ